MPREIGPRDLAERLSLGLPTLLVDVREAWEREIASLPGDIHLPLDQFGEFGPALPSKEGTLVVLYCHQGVRSYAAAAYLEQKGRTDAVSLAGGIDLWSFEVDPKVPRY